MVQESCNVKHQWLLWYVWEVFSYYVQYTNKVCVKDTSDAHGNQRAKTIQI